MSRPWAAWMRSMSAKRVRTPVSQQNDARGELLHFNERYVDSRTQLAKHWYTAPEDDRNNVEAVLIDEVALDQG